MSPGPGALTRAKLEQAGRLVAAAGVDLWLILDRETAESCDPVLPLILAGGLTWPSALLFGRDGQRIAVVGNYDADPLRVSGDWDEVIGYVQSLREPLLEALDRLISKTSHPPRIAIDFSTDDAKADGLSHGLFLQLEEYLRGTRYAGCLVSAEEIVLSLRSRKTPGEIERIKAAVAETDRLFAEVAAFARVGVSEREIYDFVQARIDRRGFGYAWDRTGDPIVNSGPDSMIGHGIPSADIRIAPGHILHLDLGVTVDDYSTDIQRCWYIPREGEETIPDVLAGAFEAVSGAITAGSGLLRPGIEGWRVDEAARNSLVGQGYPEYQHSLGHQVGRMAHDGGALLGPRWERYGRMPFLPVEEDQIFTLELGAMVAGCGYLGLEEMVLVTGAGCRWLTDRQLSLPLL